jgi:hypothetical protein
METLELQKLMAEAGRLAMTYALMAGSKYAQPITKARRAQDAARAADAVSWWILTHAPNEKVNREAWSREATRYLSLAEAWLKGS